MQEEAQHAESVNEEVMPVEGENQEVETPEKVKEWSSEDEEKARFLGWKDPSEWQGDKPPQGLIEDPRAYLDRAESILPFRKLQERYDQLEQSVSKIDRVYAQRLQAERQQAQAQIKALQERQKEAVETGDTEAWERARKAEDSLRERLQPQEPQQREVPPQVAEAIDEWRVDNPWFGQDQEKTKQAASLWAEAEKQGFKTPKAILKYIDKQMTPQTQEPQRQQSAVEGGLNFGSAPEPFSKLPKEAKDAFKRMVKQGLFTDDKAGRSEYYKEYENV